jgi:thiol-disulfide isomerase/thioredoxin
MRPVLPLIAALALVAILVIGLTQAGGGSSPPDTGRGFDLAAARQRLQGAPAPLARLYAQANRILPGGRPAFEARLRALRGHPVVVNKWASWCGPCRAELPILQDVATERGRRIAFVGVDARDERPAAAAFLRRYPLPYPSYDDPSEKIARFLQAPSNFPITVFLDARGRSVFMHQGGYRSKADLVADLDRHLER